MYRLTAHTVNTYLAIFLVALVGALATHAIIRVSEKVALLSDGSLQELSVDAFKVVSTEAR